MVSIIVPVYNVEKYLDECVESVLNLKTDVEVLLIDDGSTDSSGKMCDCWAEREPRVRVIHQENGGLSAARNTGIRNSNGEYVIFLDSDDFLDAIATDELLSCLDSGADVFLGMYQNYFADTQRYEEESCEGFLSCRGLTPVDQFLAAVPTDGRSCYMIACRFVVRREFLISNDLFFTSGIYHEDEEWTQRMLCCTDSVYVTHCFFYQYRQARAGAITATVKPKHVFDTFTILERAAELLQRQEPGSAKEHYLKHRMANLYLNNLLNLYVLDKQQRESGYRELLRSRDICSQWMTGRIGATVKLFDRILGLRITCFLLHVLRKVMK